MKHFDTLTITFYDDIIKSMYNKYAIVYVLPSAMYKGFVIVSNQEWGGQSGMSEVHVALEQHCEVGGNLIFQTEKKSYSKRLLFNVLKVHDSSSFI